MYFKWLEHYYTLKNHSLHTVLSWCLFTVGCSTKKGTLLSWKLYQVGFSIWPIPLLCGPYKSIVRVNWKSHIFVILHSNEANAQNYFEKVTIYINLILHRMLLENPTVPFTFQRIYEVGYQHVISSACEYLDITPWTRGMQR